MPGGNTPTDAALAFDQVGMTFANGATVLRDLSLAIAPGEFVALIGGSGSGKSTILRIASGLATPSAGTVTVGAEAAGYIFQDPTLLPWRTVQRNVELFAELDGIPRDRRRALAADAIALAGLRGYERYRPRQLSGGMRMRVSLARALTVRPSLFLFDEPFGALDEITRERLGEEVLRLYAAQHFAALFVTHSVAEAAQLASRVLVLSARSGTVAAEVPIPFDYPRDRSLRYDAAFGRVARTLSDALQDSFA